MSEDAEEKKEPHRIYAANAAQIWKWLHTRGGLALWQSVDLSDPGKSWTGPLHDAEGVRVTKPHWKADTDPYRIIKDPAEVVVETYKEVRRFKIAIRRGSQGMSLKLTDHSSQKVRNACAKAGEDSTYEFDYDSQEAVIFVPDTVVPLTEWAKNEGLLASQG